jgi:hypothetical protein
MGEGAGGFIHPHTRDYASKNNMYLFQKALVNPLAEQKIPRF